MVILRSMGSVPRSSTARNGTRISADSASAVQLVGRDKPYRRALVPERGSHAGKQKRLAQPRRPQQQKVLLVRFREPVCIAAQKVAVPQGGFALRARGECHGVEFGKRAKRHAGIFPVRMLHGLAHAAHPPPVGG